MASVDLSQLSQSLWGPALVYTPQLLLQILVHFIIWGRALGQSSLNFNVCSFVRIIAISELYANLRLLSLQLENLEHWETFGYLSLDFSSVPSYLISTAFVEKPSYFLFLFFRRMNWNQKTLIFSQISQWLVRWKGDLDPDISNLMCSVALNCLWEICLVMRNKIFKLVILVGHSGSPL